MNIEHLLHVGRVRLSTISKKLVGLFWRLVRPTYVFAVQADKKVETSTYKEALERWSERLGKEDATDPSMRMFALQEQLERIRGLEAKAVGGLQASALLAGVVTLLVTIVVEACGGGEWLVLFLIPGIGFFAISAIAFARVLMPSPRYYPFPDFGLEDQDSEVEVATAWDMNVKIEIHVGNLVSAGILDLGRAAVFFAGIGIAALMC